MACPCTVLRLENNMTDTYANFVRDGLMVTVTHDNDSFYFDDIANWVGICIDTGEWNTNPYGDATVLEVLPDWEDELELLQCELEDFRAANEGDNSLLETREHVAGLRELCENIVDHIDVRPDIRTFHYKPYVDRRAYEITVNVDKFAPDNGLKLSEVEAAARGMAEAFKIAEHGGIFHIRVSNARWDEDLEEYEQGEHLDSIGGVMFKDECPTNNEIWDYVAWMMGAR